MQHMVRRQRVAANPLVSIVINNYNYAQFLEAAIRSALRQTYVHKEVIVVDDGSTDDSRKVIAGFGDRVIPVLKENEGQASTFNAGFEQSRGEIVVYLDADDLLMPQAVEKAVALFDSNRVVKVHWPLWEIDADGRSLGKIHRDSLIEGDFRDEIIRRGPVALAQSPTSGNAWARWFLREVMPLPEHEDKHGADGFLKKLCPIFGEIRRVTTPQGYYRIHRSNYGGGRGTKFKLRRGLKRYPTYCWLLAEHLARMGVPVDPAEWMGPDSQYAWLKNYAAAAADLERLVPVGDPLILIDNGALGVDYLPQHRVLPFLEDQGEFGGPPHDDQQAVQELEEWRREGVRFVALAFCAFWWLDAYPQFFEHLRSRSESLLENERLRVFSLTPNPQDIKDSPDSTVAPFVQSLNRDKPSGRNTLKTLRVDDGRLPARHPFVNGSTVADLCQDLFGSAPSEIRVLGEGSNNCRAFKLRVKSQKIKCYECQSPERAKWVVRATQFLLGARVPIPRVLAVVDHVVFAEWIGGNELAGGGERSVWQRMAAYQAQIHQAPVSSPSPSSQEFVHLDWLFKRLEDGSQGYVCRSYLRDLMQSLRELTPAGLKVGIVQPDFIRSNVVVSEAGELVIIDNEFLGVGLGFEFDILNTSHAVSAGDDAKQQRYLDAYAEVGDLGTLSEHATFWDLCYLTKLAGKRFLLSDPARGKAYLKLLDVKLQEYARGES